MPSIMTWLRKRNPLRKGRLLWLINRKQPGKICRKRQFRHGRDLPGAELLQINKNDIMRLDLENGVARRSHS
jgi:hypothetical protein